MHLLRDLAPIQATFGQPGAGALGSALDQRAREREIGWRSDQWTKRRSNEELDSFVESMPFVPQLAPDPAHASPRRRRLVGEPLQPRRRTSAARSGVARHG